jgi:hypothetical protein
MTKDQEAILALTKRVRELEDSLRRVVDAASELTSWDWPRLLVDCADSDVATRDAAFLEEQLPQARALLTPSAQEKT